MNEILDSPINTEKKFKYAGFWIRVGAYFIDGIILWIFQMVLAYTAFDGYRFGQPNIPLTIISALAGILYFTIMESSSKQATLGKMGVGIKDR